VGVDAVLAAVLALPGVRDAQIRTAADGDRTLRLDLAEGADEAEVAERVTAVLRERLGVAAGPIPPAPIPEASVELVLDAPPRAVLLERVKVVTGGLDVSVEVAMRAGEVRALGHAQAPAVEGAVLRAVATATLAAVDELAAGRVRCGLDQAELVAMGVDTLAVAVVTLASRGRVDRLAGAAMVRGDARQAVARAVMGALNRRLDALISDTVMPSGPAILDDPRHTGARETR
jgi:hypothetical protein